jgi:hypothetical protein
MKRRWFQIHLSTAIVLMFVAGVLLWRNIVPLHIAWYDPIVSSHGQAKFHQAMLDGKFWLTGWPTIMTIHAVDPSAGPIDQPSLFITGSINVLAGVLILAACAVSIEFLFRRCEAQEK